MVARIVKLSFVGVKAVGITLVVFLQDVLKAALDLIASHAEDFE